MKKSTKFLLAALVCGAPLLASAQVGIGIGINLGGVVREGPPPPLVESYGPAPAGPGWFWIGGHWARHHGRWIWIGGRWVAPAAPPQVVYAPPPPQVVYAPPPPTGEIVVQAAPPAPIAEDYGVAPGPDFFWIGGHWGWAGGRWAWNRGYWGRHPHWHPGGGWEAGHWDRRGGGYVWREGHWR